MFVERWRRGDGFGVTRQARTKHKRYYALTVFVASSPFYLQVTKPTNMGERGLDGYGTITWWGFSPAVDLQETGETSRKSQNITAFYRTTMNNYVSLYCIENKHKYVRSKALMVIILLTVS